MHENSIIQVEHVSKKYCKFLKRSMLYGVQDILRNSLGRGSGSEKLRPHEFWALDEISFEVKKGETLGIIGPNGSGKTTLLKLLNGIFWPDRGRIEIRGRVGALIEVGAGFHPLLTGRENIYINAAILGMTKQEVNARFDAIVDFAGIGDFLDTPVKNYSSGMYVRLGFAVAVHADLDVLLVDEVLAVGDMQFYTKCMQKMGEIKKQGASIIIVSHDMPTIQRICHRAVLLNQGILVGFAQTSEIINKYYSLISHLPRRLPKKPERGAEEIELIELKVTNGQGKKTQVFASGDAIRLQCRFSAIKAIHNPIIHFSIDGNSYHGYNTKDSDAAIETLDTNTTITLHIDYLGLSSGVYHICLAVWDTSGVYPYYWNWDVMTITVHAQVPPLGNFGFKHIWHIEKD